MRRSVTRALAALQLTMTGAAGCAHVAPCDGGSCAAACPRDAVVDSSGRCACADEDVPLLGACVPRPVGEAFCGPGEHIETVGGWSGCAFQACGPGQWLDVVSGACAPRSSFLGRIECREPAVAVVEAGRPACIPAEAACPRGTRARELVPHGEPVPHGELLLPHGELEGSQRLPSNEANRSRRLPSNEANRSQNGTTCERPPACPPGSLADGKTCRPIVTGVGRAENRVDVGAWAALALGIHGGRGSPALCQPLGQRPSLFGVPALGKGTGAAAPDGGALEPAPRTVRVAVAILLPDQDVSRVHARVQATAGGHPLSTVAEAFVSATVGTAIEALRGLGGEASAASVEVEVTCAVGEAPGD